MQLQEDDSVKLPIGNWWDQIVDWLDNELKSVFWQQSIVMLYALVVVLVATALWTAVVTAIVMKFAMQDERTVLLQWLRRVLTGVTWIHPFGLMLPAVFFFGIGQSSSMTLATFMALPIAIGASITTDAADGNGGIAELMHRVRSGVQAAAIPALVLLGLFAIMGMGGIGQFLFRALSRQDPALGGHATAAMWLIGFIVWALLGPWSFDHLPGRADRHEQHDEAPAVQEPMVAA